MAKYGINPKNAYGVSIPNLRKMAKKIKRDHLLSQQLWASSVHEARILATMIDNPKMVTDKQIERWVRGFYSWDICDQCCNNLFKKTKFAYQKAVAWSSREEEFVKRAGFVLMACLAVSDKKTDGKQFERFLFIIKREAIDNRTYVKKAVNWALRQIGKRNLNLNRKAIETTKEIRKMDSRSAKWIASDAIRELTSEAIQKRLQGKKSGGKKISKKIKAPKSWQEKLADSKDLPKVEKITEKMSRRWGQGTVVIPAPKEVDEIMKKVPKGKLITINEIRRILAKRHGASIGCPITTGIFAWIAAYAADETAEKGKKNITPYWRTLKTGGIINEKYPGGVEIQKKLLEKEGHKVIQKGKKYVVVDSEKYLVEL